MSGNAPRVPYIELLRDPRWQKKRLEIMKRDDFKCRECGDSQSNLQVHHKRYVRDKAPWEVPNGMLVTLCFRCHERITKLRARANDLLADLNLYELPIVVEFMEGFWGKHAEPAPAVTPPPSVASPADRAITAGAFRASIERMEIEKNFLLAQEFTRESSHRVDLIDGHIADAWEALATS